MASYSTCTVYDMVAKQYGRPFFAVSEGSAIRGFADEVNSGADSVIAKHPADFQLFVLGEFDDSSGQITLLSTPRLLANASALVKRPGALGEAEGGGNRVASDSQGVARG